MQLSELLSGINYIDVKGNTDLNISSLSCDSRRVKKDGLFFCLEGTQTDGHIFAHKAVADGAVALVCGRDVNLADDSVCRIIVSDTRAVMSKMAKTFFHSACDLLNIISVVGTNGKTSTTYLLDAILKETGEKTAVIGSNGVWIGERRIKSALTTPDPIDLHELFYKIHLNKIRYVIMEVSAHAIALKKMEGVTSDIAVFTNLSQDHLDFFKNMQTYAAVKESFFDKKYVRVGVINADDELGMKILKNADLSMISYGCENPADVFASDFEGSEKGISYTLGLCGETKRVSYSLKGKFNMYNTLAASAAARLYGIKADVIAQGISKVKSIDGRNETFFMKSGARVVVDFAHTPDGVENILSYMSSTGKKGGRLIVVFGCGGGRDKFKRPLMGKAVAKYADLAIVTDDNPRFEDSFSIFRDIVAGLKENYEIIQNREDAIFHALNQAGAADTVAILGKGAERYQEIKGRKYPFYDIEVVHRFLG